LLYWTFGVVFSCDTATRADGTHTLPIACMVTPLPCPTLPDMEGGTPAPGNIINIRQFTWNCTEAHALPGPTTAPLLGPTTPVTDCRYAPHAEYERNAAVSTARLFIHPLLTPPPSLKVQTDLLSTTATEHRQQVSASAGLPPPRPRTPTCCGLSITSTSVPAHLAFFRPHATSFSHTIFLPACTTPRRILPRLPHFVGAHHTLPACHTARPCRACRCA